MQLTEVYREHVAVVPVDGVPPWSEKVARWQQLDPVSEAMLSAWHCWQTSDQDGYSQLPSLLFIASQEGSLHADREFVNTGAVSPARFVATLPSVYLSALGEAHGWTGTFYCIQGVNAFAKAKAEAASILQDGIHSRAGIFSHAVAKGPKKPTQLQVAVQYLELTKEGRQCHG